jgi:phosphate transport system substrate-binding protein
MFDFKARIRTAAFLMAGMLLAGIGCSGKGGSRIDLQGAGASFPEPIYKKWFAEYMKIDSDLTINYQGKGSGFGIAQFTKGTVFFGASDAAMNDDEIKKVDGNVFMLPMTAGAVVLTYNLKDESGNEIKDLKLSRKAYTGIFSGKVTNWSDDEIKQSNKGLNLPDQEVKVRVRADSSGTTYVFTSHLSAAGLGKADKEFKIPSGGTFSKEAQNAGVTNAIKQTPGSIGYVEYSYAFENKLPMAHLENKKGKLIEPTPESGRAALAGAELPENMRLFVPDPEGETAYPIVSYTWLLVKKKYEAWATDRNSRPNLGTSPCLTASPRRCWPPLKLSSPEALAYIRSSPASPLAGDIAFSG